MVDRVAAPLGVLGMTQAPRVLCGVIRCCDCRQMWESTWNTQAPTIICHECGGSCVPLGPQLPVRVSASAIDGEMFRLERQQMRRTAS